MIGLSVPHRRRRLQAGAANLGSHGWTTTGSDVRRAASATRDLPETSREFKSQQLAMSSGATIDRIPRKRSGLGGGARSPARTARLVGSGMCDQGTSGVVVRPGVVGRVARQFSLDWPEASADSVNEGRPPANGTGTLNASSAIVPVGIALRRHEFHGGYGWPDLGRLTIRCGTC